MEGWGDCGGGGLAWRARGGRGREGGNRGFFCLLLPFPWTVMARTAPRTPSRPLRPGGVVGALAP